MASRAEYKQMCKELGLDSDSLTMEDMDTAIREEADRMFKSKKIKHSADLLSKTLRKFLTNEYDYVIMNYLGNKLNENLKEK